MVIAKIIGGIFVITSCSLAGFCIKFKTDIQIKELNNLLSCIDIMKNEMCIALKNVFEAIKIASDNASKINRDFFDQILNAQNDNTDIALFTKWENALEKSNFFKQIYGNKEMEALKNFGCVLGSVNVEVQEENFDRFKCATQDRINELKNNSKKSSIMGNLGVYIGIIIVILIF